MKASDTISHILDLVRFEYERKNISLHEQFLLMGYNRLRGRNNTEGRATRTYVAKI